MNKEIIILAIAFIKTYPVLGNYLNAMKEHDDFLINMKISKNTKERDIINIDYYNNQFNIADIALKNGYFS